MTPCTIDDVKSYDSPKIYKRHDGWPPLEHAKGHVIAELRAQNAALLAEVERLQRERSEWCDRADALMTEQMTQMRDLTAEVEALRARLTLTPEKIEAAAKAQYEFDNPGGPEFKACTFRCLYLGASRAALLAAGMTDAALDAAEGGGR